MNHNLYDYIVFFIIINGGNCSVLPRHLNIQMCTILCVCEFFFDWITEKWCVWTESETGCGFSVSFFTLCVRQMYTNINGRKEREHLREKKRPLGREKKRNGLKLKANLLLIWHMSFDSSSERFTFLTTCKIVKVFADFRWIVFDFFSLLLHSTHTLT